MFLSCLRFRSATSLERQLLILATTLSFSFPVYAASNKADGEILSEANRLAAHSQYTEAEKLYQKFLDAHPLDATAHHTYGRVLALQKKYEEALHEYKIALKLKPGDTRILNDIGVTLAINNIQNLGARFLHQAILLDKAYCGAWANLGVALNSLTAYEQAINSFDEAIKIQPRNVKLRELKERCEKKIADNKSFEYGLPVSWKDIPDTLKQPEAATATMASSETGEKKTTPKGPPKKVELDEEDKEWLEQSKPHFVELKASGFASVCLAGNGMVQIGDKCDEADSFGQIELAPDTKIEIMGDVTVDLIGQGQMQLGKSQVTAKAEDCILSASVENNDLSCYAGDFKASSWASVTAKRTASKVEVEADECQSVYSQDDSKVDATNCDEVTLVGHSTGVLTKCKKVVLNDESSAVARECAELTAMANSRVRAEQCVKVEQLDRSKVEVKSD